MPVLIGLLVAAILGYLIYRRFFAPGATPAAPAAPAARSEQAFAFLSNGLLFYRERGGEVKQLHSIYAQEAIDRRERGVFVLGQDGSAALALKDELIAEVFAASA